MESGSAVISAGLGLALISSICILGYRETAKSSSFYARTYPQIRLAFAILSSVGLLLILVGLLAKLISNVG